MIKLTIFCRLTRPAIESANRNTRQDLPQGFLELLGALPHVLKKRAIARSAGCWNVAPRVTVVTKKRARLQVDGERDRAAIAALGLTALAAEHEVGPSPSIEQDHGLMPGRERRREALA